MCNRTGGEGDTGDLAENVSGNPASGGGSVGIGATPGSVRAFCGEPSFVNKTTETVQVGTSKGALWFYDFGSYQAKIQLEFISGKLTSIKNR